MFRVVVLVAILFEWAGYIRLANVVEYVPSGAFRLVQNWDCGPRNG